MNKKKRIAILFAVIIVVAVGIIIAVASHQKKEMDFSLWGQVLGKFNNKKAGVLRSWMSSISFPLGVEFTNSYPDHVNSTSHFDAHFSGFWLIIDAF